MEHQLLSLKNIYRLLMASDFPLYSESVIGEKERKGVTVLRFWQQILIEEFKNLPCGRMIWRSSGARNRYTSQLCNRSLTPGLYGTYAAELASRLSKDNRPQPGGPLLAVSLRQAVQARRSSAAGGSVFSACAGQTTPALRRRSETR